MAAAKLSYKKVVLIVKLDAKQKILMAIYIEYQKDSPNYEAAVYNRELGVSTDEVLIALKMLQNEGLISGFEWRLPSGKFEYNICNTMLSPAGQSYIEKKLDINPLDNGKEKLEKIVNSALKIGWQVVSDIAAKVIVEMMTKK